MNVDFEFAPNCLGFDITANVDINCNTASETIGDYTIPNGTQTRTGYEFELDSLFSVWMDCGGGILDLLPSLKANPKMFQSFMDELKQSISTSDFDV